METEMIKWLVENGAVAVPFVLLMWGRLEMIGRKVAKIDRRMTKVETKQEMFKSEMFHRTGQLSKQ